MQPVPILATLLVRAVTLVMLMAALLAMPAFAGESSYTRHDYEACAKRPSPHPGVVEIRQCKGLAGIPVVWTAEPDASSVDFGKATTLAKSETIPLLDTFYEAGRTVEWRGPVIGGAMKPLAAIIRYATGPGIGNLGKSRLVIHRLMPNGATCVMGVVAGTNEQARALVDSHAAEFVCGRSKAILRS